MYKILKDSTGEDLSWAFYLEIYTANRELYMQDFMQTTETATTIKHRRGAVI